MATEATKSNGVLLTLLFISMFFNSCVQMSKTVTDNNAGINGDFEYEQNGLPINWILYTPQTIENADFDIVIDTTDFKEGKQSLKFDVRKCAALGGRMSPGFTQEFKANPGETYKINFWVKNIGSHFSVQISSVNAFNAIPGPALNTSEAITNWRQFEYTFTIPEKMNALRFELNVLQPGNFWIDAVSIEKQATISTKR